FLLKKFFPKAKCLLFFARIINCVKGNPASVLLQKEGGFKMIRKLGLSLKGFLKEYFTFLGTFTLWSARLSCTYMVRKYSYLQRKNVLVLAILSTLLFMAACSSSSNDSSNEAVDMQSESSNDFAAIEMEEKSSEDEAKSVDKAEIENVATD